MTTSQHIPPADRVDIARFDDDGGAPSQSSVPRPAAPPATASPAEPGGADAGGGVAGAAPRLTLSPDRGEGSFDGGWWPRTMRLTDELPGLLTALAGADESVRRVCVNGDAWTAIPSLAGGSGLPRARVDWFRTLDRRVVTAGSDGGLPRLRLLVIPPEAAAGPARVLLRAAAAGALTGSPGEILRQGGAEAPAKNDGPTHAEAQADEDAPTDDAPTRDAPTGVAAPESSAVALVASP
ncbi:DUF5994 family protein [Frankia sp. ACN10a]|uniref:DUF5994 family protein n=1 Tax=Frankia sp. ACN10a TaxID=2926031 RepID=UPI00211880A1|nr:DUF5994 family protein [Frankia sp. ACN10a]